MSKANGRKTKELSYNLFNRGVKLNGIDRSNVNFQVMIDLINSDQVQELVESGHMYGYYGHQIRQRFGMIPPESAFVDGKTVKLEPAIKTVSISADKDGNVRHVEEFLENDSGEFSMRQYQTKVGGFSTAVNYKEYGANLVPVGFFGNDYVIQPNYVTNVGDGQLFDSLFLPIESTNEFALFDSMTDINALNTKDRIIAQLLEKQIIDSFDSMAQINHLVYQCESALDLLSKEEKRKQLIKERQKSYSIGVVSGVSSFDSMVQEAEKKLDLVEHINKDQDVEISKKGLYDYIKNIKNII